MKWQPIETAEEMKRPVDGHEWRGCPKVLLWVNGEFFTGRWDADFHATKKRPYWDMDTNRGRRWIRDNQPTHWMQVLPPQQSLSSDEEAQSADTGSQQERGQPDTTNHDKPEAAAKGKGK